MERMLQAPCFSDLFLSNLFELTLGLKMFDDLLYAAGAASIRASSAA
jgi:hypothetical protein